MEQKIIGTTTVFFTDRCREKNKGILKLTHPAMLAEEETLCWLDSIHLDDVAAKFIQADGNSISGETAFSDEILDRAMREAIEKAQNYLKPFFCL